MYCLQSVSADIDNVAVSLDDITAVLSCSGKVRASIRKKKKRSPPPIPNFNGNGALPGEEQEVAVSDSHMSVM